MKNNVFAKNYDAATHQIATMCVKIADQIGAVSHDLSPCNPEITYGYSDNGNDEFIEGNWFFAVDLPWLQTNIINELISQTPEIIIHLDQVAPKDKKTLTAGFWIRAIIEDE